MMYDLPETVTVGGKDYKVRTDYRAILDICIALTDPDLTPRAKTIVVIGIFYEEEPPVEEWEEAIKACFDFIDMGQSGKKGPKLMDWKQDFQFIVAPINRVLGGEIRACKYLHWWTFMSAYYEIGDCLFAQIVRIRNQKARGKKLDKTDQEWYRQNRDIVDIKTTYAEAEKALLKEWGAN